MAVGDSETGGVTDIGRHPESFFRRGDRLLEVAQGRVSFGAPRAEADIDRKHKAGLLTVSIHGLEQRQTFGELPHRLRNAPEIPASVPHDEPRIAPRSQVAGVSTAERFPRLFEG